MNNSKGVLELLISKGANIDAKDINYLNIMIIFISKIVYDKSRKLDQN